MRFRAIVCPKCGGPLPPRARRAVVVCEYCEASVMVDEEVIYASKYRRALSELDPAEPSADLLRAGGLPYRLLRRIAEGEHADVHWAERAQRIKQRAVVKLYRSNDDAERLEREAAILTRLEGSETRGAAHFRRLVPIPIHHGVAKGAAGDGRPVLVYRYRSGFAHSFEEIAHAYPEGVEAHHAAWMWRRVLEVLDWMHRDGVVHGSVEAAHLVVHARDHGVMLVGFGDAAETREDAARAADLRGAARAIAFVLSGGGDTAPDSTPAPIRDLLEACSGDALPTLDAWELRERVGRAAGEAFGPPKYHHFHVPSSGG